MPLLEPNAANAANRAVPFPPDASRAMVRASVTPSLISCASFNVLHFDSHAF